MLLTSTIAKPIRSCIFPLRSYFFGFEEDPINTKGIETEGEHNEKVINGFKT